MSGLPCSPASGVVVERKRYFVVVLRTNALAFAFATLPGGQDSFPRSGDHHVGIGYGRSEQIHVGEEELELGQGSRVEGVQQVIGNRGTGRRSGRNEREWLGRGRVTARRLATGNLGQVVRETSWPRSFNRRAYSRTVAGPPVRILAVGPRRNVMDMGRSERERWEQGDAAFASPWWHNRACSAVLWEACVATGTT